MTEAEDRLWREMYLPTGEHLTDKVCLKTPPGFLTHPKQSVETSRPYCPSSHFEWSHLSPPTFTPNPSRRAQETYQSRGGRGIQGSYWPCRLLWGPLSGLIHDREGSWMWVVTSLANPSLPSSHVTYRFCVPTTSRKREGIKMLHEVIIYANSLYEHSEFRAQILTQPEALDTWVQMIPLRRWKQVGADTAGDSRSIGP